MPSRSASSTSYRSGSASRSARPTRGPDNEVDEEDVIGTTVSGTPETGQRLQWTLEPPIPLRPAQTAQIVFAAIIDGALPPDLGTSGDEIVNSARFSYENSSGEIFVVPDNGSVVFSEAHVTLTKGIISVDGSAEFSPPRTRSATSRAARPSRTPSTYATTVRRDAFGIEVRDLLPINADGITSEDATCAQISAYLQQRHLRRRRHHVDRPLDRRRRRRSGSRTRGRCPSRCRRRRAGATRPAWSSTSPRQHGCRLRVRAPQQHRSCPRARREHRSGSRGRTASPLPGWP